MPELPEVEIARRNLSRWFEGRVLLGVEADDTRILRGVDKAALKRVKGRLEKAERKGKYLLLRFESPLGLMSHLGMTGKYVRRDQGVAEPYSRVRFHLDSQEVIHYRDPRMFGRMEAAPRDELWQIKAVAALGHDPLNDGLSGAQLKEALGQTRVALKVALMDQSRVAGLGNIHAAEALYRAKIHPARKVASLSDAEWRALARHIHNALLFALSHEEGDEIEYVEEPGAPNPFLVYGRKKEVCPRCQSAIASIPQGGRTTFFCPGCQPKAPPRKPVKRARG